MYYLCTQNIHTKIPENMEEDFDINEVAFTIEVGGEVIEKVRKGDRRGLIYD